MIKEKINYLHIFCMAKATYVYFMNKPFFSSRHMGPPKGKKDFYNLFFGLRLVYPEV